MVLLCCFSLPTFSKTQHPESRKEPFISPHASISSTVEHPPTHHRLWDNLPQDLFPISFVGFKLSSSPSNPVHLKITKPKTGKWKKMKRKRRGLIRSVFMHSDKPDLLLMALGLAGDGLVMPSTLLITSKLMNDIGSSNSNLNSLLVQSVNRNALLLCYVASGAWLLCFLEGYCWTRTEERQAARMRVDCLRAALRQDISYFDLQQTNTSEIVTIVSDDGLVIQDCIAEKVPNFLMNVASFIGNEMVAFLMLWKLAMVELPFVILLVIPGLMYSRIQMGIARKLREEYKEAGSVAEQAISSIRTVYAFVGETGTISRFSAALQGSVKLGLRHGLAKGFAIGSNGLILGVAAFNCCYGSRLVINHGVKGGTVFAVGATIAGGGFALGSALSNVWYLSEATSAGERIMEMMERV